jgi:sec-independent protein translocase protein TatA
VQETAGTAVGKKIGKFNFTDMRSLLLFGSFGAGEVIVIALIVLLLFGGKKIPELMKGIGKGVKSFKDGVKGIEDEINADIKLDDKKEEKK